MAIEIPIARHFLACREVILDSTGRNVTLRNLIHAIVRLPGEPFPCIRPEMALYAVLTNGRGIHEFAIDLAFFDGVQSQPVFQSVPRRVDLGSDPSVIHGLPIPMNNMVFDHPGQFTFGLICDGQRIAEERIEVR